MDFIEMVVEECELGIAVAVIAIDLDWGTILEHFAAFRYADETKRLTGNNSNQ
jgi:hypothetical protein